VAQSRTRLAIWLVLAGLALGSAVAAAAVYDSKRKHVEVAFLAYLGDLKTLRFQSASLRMLPADLAALKQAALDRASEYPEFRDAAMRFLGAADPADLAAERKERFFEFLLDRTFGLHPEIHAALSQGSVIGMRIRRDGRKAHVDATLDLPGPGKARHFVMQVDLVELDDEWLVRL